MRPFNKAGEGPPAENDAGTQEDRKFSLEFFFFGFIMEKKIEAKFF